MIRKYGNRRLYDTHLSRYVTLEDLVGVFGGEEPVRVVDAVSGQDLTKRVLAQTILFEESRRQTQIIPIDLLRSLLRRHAKPESVGRAVERSLSRGSAVPPAVEVADLERRLQALETRLKRPRARR